MGGMVIQFGTKFKFSVFFNHGVVNGKKKRLVFQKAGNEKKKKRFLAIDLEALLPKEVLNYLLDESKKVIKG